MIRIKQITRISSALLVIWIVAAGCTPFKNTSEPCKGIIDWVDIIMINDIKYAYNDEGAGKITLEQIGDPIGEVQYMLDEHACTNHVLRNGDAAYLPIGTTIYELKGYKPEFRIVAANKMYQVGDNPHAATLRDLLDIEGKVEKVSLNSGIDGSPIGDFSAEASSTFIEELLPLSYVGFNKVYQQTKHEAGVFLRVHLQDGTSFRMVYYPNANAFNPGAFGTDSLKELIMSERARIKAAAGL